ncbi:MAG: Ig-like domain-containing protein [Fibrobacteria bacterium]
MNKHPFLFSFSTLILCGLLWNCNNAALDEVKVLQVHLDDSLSVQAGHYDSIRIDLADKDGNIWKERVFFGPYDKVKDKGRLENLEIPSSAPSPLKVVISAYKNNQKQAEFLFQISSDDIAKPQPTAFIPPKKDSVAIPIDTTKPKDTLAVPIPSRLTFASRDIELFDGGDSLVVHLNVLAADSAREVIFKSKNEEVFMVAGGGHLFPKTVGQALLIAFFAGFPSSGDTARVSVIKDPPVLDAGLDRKAPLDSQVSFPIHVTQRHGRVKSLKWDLDGDGKYEDSASTSDTVLTHTYKNKNELTVKFYARDTEGNETTKTLKVQAGILTPLVIITKPSADTTVNTTPFLLEYLVDGQTKTKSVPLKIGPTIVPISETNQYGVGSDTVIITLDTIPPGKPTFTSQTPAYSKIRRPTWVWAQNPTEKGNGTFMIRLDGIGDTLITTAQSYTATIDQIDGPHFLQVQERDAAGNWSAPVSQTIYVDLAKPVVTIETPSTLGLFRTGEGSVIVTGSASDVGGISTVTYTVGSKTANATGMDKWKTGSIPIIDNATTTVIVSIEDKAGNIGADTLRIQSDMRGPGVTITQPSAVGSFFTTGGTLAIKGTAIDSSSIKYVKYSLSGATTDEGDATGTVNWQIPTLYLRPGTTQLSVVAYDSLLNPGFLILDITYKSGVYLVDASAHGKNTGTNWADAFTDLQTALTSNILGEIWVAKGTYKPTSGADRSVSFVTQASLHLYGGFKGSETAREQRDLANNTTILSGEIGSTVATDNSYHVVRGASNTTIDGFTITGGYADVGLTENGKGGAIYVNGFSPNILNCTFKNNYAASSGGAVSINGSLSQFINCIFADNKAEGQGGGLEILGNSSPVVLNSLFIRNTTTNAGAGISMDIGMLTVKNTLFSANDAPYGRNIAFNGTLTFQNTNADTNYVGGILYAGSDYVIKDFGNNDAKDPVFVGPNNFRLKAGSPGIDEGIDGPDVPKFDIEGKLRPLGRQIDEGPYEQ